MNIKLIHLALCASVSFFAGLLLATGGFRGDASKTLGIAGLSALPVGYLSYLITDSKAANKLRKAEREASEYGIKLSSLERLHSESETKLADVSQQLELLRTANSKLTKELGEVSELLAHAQVERIQSVNLAESLRKQNEQLAARIEDLEAETEEWQAQFHNRVETEADKRFQIARAKELESIFQEHDQMTQKAMTLYRQLREVMFKVVERNEGKSEIVKGMASNYNSVIDEFNQRVDKEREALLEQLEACNMRVGLLQHELAGDLVEPVYLECGFDESGRIANAIARWLWVNRQIPLRVTGFENNPDGSVTTGFTYSRSLPLEALLQQIERDTSHIAKSLGLYALEKAFKLPLTDCLAVRVRRDRPFRKADRGSLYRNKEEFIKYILSHPIRLRIVGEPGSGKTPSVATVLSHILKRGFLAANTPNGQKLPHCIAESCNPLAGVSVKNGDDLDPFLKWNVGEKGFRGLADEYKFRKNPANSDYKNRVGYIWIADEIDNSMADLTKDEAKPFKDVLKDGGHINIGCIVMGQSANVSTSKGLSIDDQKMLTNIYIDPVSIRTFLTQYGERFYSKRAVEKALATLEELELELEEQNEIICDTAREFRIAMVTANRSPVFYQLPYFDSVDIDIDSYQETLVKVSEIRAGRSKTVAELSVSPNFTNVDTASASARLDATRHLPYVDSETRRDTVDTATKPNCPHCDSDLIRSKGNSWLCLNPAHSVVAPNQPKSWKK